MAKPSTSAFQREHHVACLAVQRVTLITKQLSSIHKGVQLKSDASPVSLIDFAGQALIVSAIRKNFPGDAIVGEESAADLRQDPSLASKVWELIESVRLDEENERMLSRPKSMNEMIDLIDYGGSTVPPKSGRFWTVDPVDGTKAFLDYTQYCVVASFLEDGIDKVAAMACPRVAMPGSSRGTMKISEEESGIDRNGNGVIVSAVRGQGAWIRPLTNAVLSEPQPISRANRDEKLAPNELILCENAQSRTSYLPDRHLIAERLGAPWPPVHIFSTQLKYIACALGACDVLFRAIKNPSEFPYVWDHAGGILIFEECGGKITDLTGKEVDLRAGRRMTETFGLIAAPKRLHADVLKAVKDIMGCQDQYAQYFD